MTKYTQRQLKRPKCHKICKHLQLQDPPKFTQIGIFVLKNAIWEPWFRGRIFRASQKDLTAIPCKQNPGANPTIASYNASAEKMYNAPSRC
jgi:hypothetical protein